MKLFRFLLLSVSVALLLHFQPIPSAIAQSTGDAGASLTGDWKLSSGPVVVIEQKGPKVQGAWKQAFSGKSFTCQGVWFDGEIKQNSVLGSKYRCTGGLDPLVMKIVDSDTLEMQTNASGGTATTTVLTRMK